MKISMLAIKKDGGASYIDFKLDHPLTDGSTKPTEENIDPRDWEHITSHVEGELGTRRWYIDEINVIEN